jgi:hypothetical protein
MCFVNMHWLDCYVFFTLLKVLGNYWSDGLLINILVSQGLTPMFLCLKTHLLDPWCRWSLQLLWNKPWPFPIQEREKKTSSCDKNVNKVDISPILKKRLLWAIAKSVQMCTARTIFLSQTSLCFHFFFIQFYLWPCKLKLDEENWKHAGLAKEHGFAPAVLHSLL